MRKIIDAQRALCWMSIAVLRKNLAACGQARKDWKALAAGELDKKPDCPFCGIGLCTICALFTFRDESPSPCGQEYWKWGKAWNRAKDIGRKRPLRSKPVRRAAAKMVDKIGRVRRAVAAEIRRRAR